MIQSVCAISNVQHSVNGDTVTLTYEGSSPFLINIRSDSNIGQNGGYVWAKTNSKSFTIDLSFANNPSKKFYYGVKDNSWSPINTVNLGEINNLCRPLYSNHNSISERRFNFVFEGVNFQNTDTLLEIIKTFIDLDSADALPGLFGQEPFMSNENLFNFWYIDEINTCDNISDTTCNNQAVEYYNICNFEHKFYFRFFHKDSTPWVPYLGVPNQNELWIWAFKPRVGNEPLMNIRRYIVHEFGHSFNSYNLDSTHLNLLLDEYGGIREYPNYDYILREGPWAGKIFPNVYLNESTTTIEDCKENSIWNDLIGDGCGEDGIIDCILDYTPPEISPRVYESIVCREGYPDCYKEISCFESALGYEKGVFRPTYKSIMNNGPEAYPSGFNLASQRHFCRTFKSEIDNCGGSCNNLISC